jgi:hypothetical protein
VEKNNQHNQRNQHFNPLLLSQKIPLLDMSTIAEAQLEQQLYESNKESPLLQKHNSNSNSMKATKKVHCCRSTTRTATL